MTELFAGDYVNSIIKYGFKETSKTTLSGNFTTYYSHKDGSKITFINRDNRLFIITLFKSSAKFEFMNTKTFDKFMKNIGYKVIKDN